MFTSLTGASKPHHVVDEDGVVLGYRSGPSKARNKPEHAQCQCKTGELSSLRLHAATSACWPQRGGSCRRQWSR